MNELLPTLLNLSIMLFAVSSMLSVGLSYTLQEIIAPLRNLGAVARVLLANFVLVPLLGYLITRLFSFDAPMAIGLFLVAASAGAPFLIKLVELSGGDVGISATTLVLLLPATILFLPLVVPLAVPEANVDALAVAMPLLLQMLLPLAVGLAVRQFAPDLAARLRPLLAPVSNVTLLLLIGLTVVLNFDGILGVFGTGAIVAALILILGAFGIGYMLGPRPETRDELGLATAQRNIAAASVVATQAIGEPSVLVMIVVVSLVSFALLFPISSLLRRRAEARAAATGQHVVLRRE